MKFFLSYLCVFFYIHLNANEIQWIDAQINAIKSSRIGLSKKDLLQVENPFLLEKSNQKNIVTTHTSNQQK